MVAISPPELQIPIATDTGNMLSGVMGFMILWFIFAALGAILDLLTTKEGSAVLGVLAIFGLGFLLGGDDDCDV